MLVMIAGCNMRRFGRIKRTKLHFKQGYNEFRVLTTSFKILYADIGLDLVAWCCLLAKSRKDVYVLFPNLFNYALGSLVKIFYTGIDLDM